jgi:hypothetical protein
MSLLQRSIAYLMPFKIHKRILALVLVDKRRLTSVAVLRFPFFIGHFTHSPPLPVLWCMKHEGKVEHTALEFMSSWWQ